MGLNRDKKLRSVLAKFWCGGCDASLVNAGGKCLKCGWKDGKRKFKKGGYDLPEVNHEPD